jgi:O-antigen/teichoic acid export membrane protein
MGRENIIFWASVYGAIADFVLNLIFIPRLSSTGAAIGTLVAEIIVFVVHYYILRENLAPMFKNMKLLGVLISTVAAALASFWVICLGLGDFLTLVFAAVLFFGVYGAVLLLTKDPDVFYILRKFRIVKSK